MPTIAEQVKDVKAAAASRLPAEVVAVFASDQAALAAGGIPAGSCSGRRHARAFSLSDATGQTRTLDELTADGPAVIVFYRGGWCPYCNLTLRTYQRDLLPELSAYSARLVAISPETPDASLSTQEKDELAYTVLSDTGGPGRRRARDHIRSLRGRTRSTTGPRRGHPQHPRRRRYPTADADRPDRRQRPHRAVRRHPPRLHRPHRSKRHPRRPPGARQQLTRPHVCRFVSTTCVRGRSRSRWPSDKSWVGVTAAVWAGRCCWRIRRHRRLGARFRALRRRSGGCGA